MILELDDDFTDEITVTNLADSYVSIQQNLKTPSMCWHEDDVEAWIELLPALKLVLDWYCLDSSAEIKKAKKRMKK